MDDGVLFAGLASVSLFHGERRSVIADGLFFLYLLYLLARLGFGDRDGFARVLFVQVDDDKLSRASSVGALNSEEVLFGMRKQKEW